VSELPLRAGVSSPVSRALSNSKYMPVVALTELLGFALRANTNAVGEFLVIFGPSPTVPV
jgi:hypothetical protein